jgi:quercetin dioxygenase-like cupin family protein
MNVTRSFVAAALLISAVVAAAASSSQITTPPQPERARVALAHSLPALDGSKLTVTLVEVNYGPGEFSKPHSHPCPVIGYVVSGTLRTQVQGEAAAVYKAGETFYEPPNGVHLVSANASATQPTKLLAYFVCDHDAPLSTDVPSGNPAGKE